MKFKKIMLVGLILLAILTIGAASASQDLNSSDLSVNELDDEVVPEGDVVQADDDEEVVQASDDEDNLSGIEIDADEEDGEEFTKGEDGSITISLTSNDKGTLSVYVNGTKAHLNVDEDEEDYICVSKGTGNGIYLNGAEYDEYEISFDGLSVGSYTITMNVTGSNNKVIASKTFHLDLLSDGSEGDETNSVEIDVDDNMTIVLGDPDPEYPSINFPEDAIGKLYVYVDGKQARLTTGTEANDEEDLIFVSISGTKNYIRVDAEEDFEAYEISFYKLPEGVYHVKLDYVGDSGKYTNNKEFNLTVTTVAPPEEEEEEELDISVESTYIYHDSGSKIILRGPKAIISGLNITLNGESYPISKDVNNVSYIDLTQLPVGTYYISISNTSDVLVDEEEFDIVVGGVITTSLSLDVGNYVYGENHTISLTLPRNAQGYLIVEDDETFDQLYKEELVNGSACISLADLGVGCYRFNVYYDGSGYEVDGLDNMYFEVFPKISIPSKMTVGKNEFITMEFDKNAQGSVTVDANGDSYYAADIKNGIVKVPLNNLDDGDIDIHIWYEINEYDSLEWDYSIDVLSVPAKIVAKNIKMKYLDGTNLVITVYGTNGKLVEEDEYIEVKIGNKEYEAYTNSKGVAKLKITVPPGKYKVKLNYMDEAYATKKLVVIKTLRLTNLKLKKSSKKLVLKATLKQGKKAIKNKKITFKFNGKKIGTVKTNKKGVAQITIKPKLYKKLKVGKKIKYQATYVKETVKKTVKVQK